MMQNMIIAKSASGDKSHENSRVSFRDSYHIALDSEEVESDLIDGLKKRTVFSKDYPIKAKFFNKRVCHTYVENRNAVATCAGCKQPMANGKHIYVAVEWNYRTCTRVQTTDAYGVLTFPGSSRRKANYIRVDVDSKPSELVQYLYHPDGWNLPKPYLILSIVGSTHRSVIPSHIRKAFKRGLVKTAVSTGAWMLTYATNPGVTKLVSEAVNEEGKNDRLTVMGISQWGRIALREKLKKRRDSTSSKTTFYAASSSVDDRKSVDGGHLLDSNHTHFLLFDDGTQGEINKNHNFRLKLEMELTSGYSLPAYEKQDKLVTEPERTPIVLIVVQGGVSTLKAIEEALNYDTTVLLIANTRGSSDLVIMSIASSEHTDQTLTELIEDSNIMCSKDQLSECLHVLKNIIMLQREKSHLISIFKLDDTGNDAADIESAIFDALFKSSMEKHVDNLKLTLQWNRCDVAKSYMLNCTDQIKSYELEDLLELALLLNRIDFVNFFLEYGVNIRTLSVSRLYLLYNYEEYDQTDNRRAPIHKLINKRYRSNGANCITFHNIQKFLQEVIVDDFLESFFPSDGTQTQISSAKPVNAPEMNLFLWALLMNRIQLAKLFWKLGDNQTCSALFACMVLKAMAARLPELEPQLSKAAREFEHLAMVVLSSFHENEDETVNAILLLRKTPFFEVDCLHMAIEANSQEFISHHSVQNVLTYIWNGKISTQSSGLKYSIYLVLSFVSGGLLAPFLMFNNDDEVEADKSNEKLSVYYNENQATDLLEAYLKQEISEDAVGIRSGKKLRLSNYYHYYIQFLLSPKIHFMFDTVAYLCFLGVFSYLLLCEFTYKEMVIQLNSTHNATQAETIRVIVTKKPLWIEYLLIFWIFSYFGEESRQYFSRAESRNELKKKFFSYFSDKWNYLDMFGCLFFIIGIALRFISLVTNESLFIAARIILCMDLFIWYMRLLHVSLLSKYLGPKLFIIQLMIRDLLFFMSILAIFILAYGVTTHSALYPGQSFSFELLRNLVNKAYWSIYGDLRILNELTMDFSTCTEKTTCPDPTGTKFTFVALMFYCIIANVLLINLLIAMFSYTFQNIQTNTDKIWKFQRYHLVLEHFDAPILPPPLNTFGYVLEFISKKLSKQKAKNILDHEVTHEDDFDIIAEKERKYCEAHLNNIEYHYKETLETQIKSNTERLEFIDKKLNRLTTQRSTQEE